MSRIYRDSEGYIERITYDTAPVSDQARQLDRDLGECPPNAYYSIRRVRLTRGGYLRGVYYGHSAELLWAVEATDGSGYLAYTRAYSRDEVCVRLLSVRPQSRMNLNRMKER